MVVTEEMFRTTGLAPIDTEGFAEMVVRVRGVEAAALLKEMPGYGYIKVSMRSRDAVDVCAAARVFGGGGHIHAAGCEISEDLETVRRKVAEQLRLQLSEAAHG
jgi:phosphoesterase RecJ-like protein